MGLATLLKTLRRGFDSGSTYTTLLPPRTVPLTTFSKNAFGTLMHP